MTCVPPNRPWRRVVRSMSLRNVLVIVFASSCNVGRAIGEDRLLATKDQYDAYRRQVRFRVLPGVW